MTIPTPPNRHDYVRAAGRDTKTDPHKQLQSPSIWAILMYAVPGGLLVLVGTVLLNAIVQTIIQMFR